MAEQATILRWETPPQSKTRGEGGTPWSRFIPVAEELRARPGRWAVIAEFPSRTRTSLASHVRSGAIACFTPAGDFDAVSRQESGRSVIYARYVGDPETAGAIT